MKSQGYCAASATIAERGITSVGIAGGSPQSFRIYEAVRDAGNPVRIGFMFCEAQFPAVQAPGLKSGFGDDRLRITSIKVFHGNSLSGRTCWLERAVFGPARLLRHPAGAPARRIST